MSTACNGETDEPCQTIVCKNDKPCRNLDSNSSQRQQTENTTAAAQEQQQQPDSGNSNSDDDDNTTPFPQTPPIPQIQDYMNDEFDY